MSHSNPSEKQINAGAKQPTLVHKEAVEIKPKSKSKLAIEYGVHRNTISEWCKAIGIKTAKKLSISEIKAFYTHYDYPGSYVLE